MFVNNQLKSLLMWVGLIVGVVLASILYQPTAASTGSLLIWMDGVIYRMDIDTMKAKTIAPADSGATMRPSPGCYRKMGQPCWVAVDDTIYSVLSPETAPIHLRQEDEAWLQAPLSWSPDGVHGGYVISQTLYLLNLRTGQRQALASPVEATSPLAWSADCKNGVSATCRVAFRVVTPHTSNLVSALTPAVGEQTSWSVEETVTALRWTTANELLYHSGDEPFRFVTDETPHYPLPPNASLSETSPDGQYTVFYKPFTLSECQSQDKCLYIGVWLGNVDEPEARLIYNVDTANTVAEGLNFVPTWSPSGANFVFFQEGNLVYYSLEKEKAAIWYKSLLGKLRSLPVFSPSEDAVAFVDNQGQGLSEYRLLIINPRLKPIEHIIKVKDGFRILAWLPD